MARVRGEGVPVIYALIGMRIKEVRTGLGISQLELSEKSGFSRTNLTMTENGKQRIQIENLYKIARALDVPVSTFLPDIDGEFDRSITELFEEFLRKYFDKENTNE